MTIDSMTNETFSNEERARILHDRATKAAKMHTWSEKELIFVFAELDSFGGYRFYEAKNLYQYAMKVHKLSEAVALNLINIARKSREVPEIREAVLGGKISVSAARKIVPVITKDSAQAWIELAATHSVRQVEKAVAEAKPEMAVRETARFVMKDRLEVILSLDEEAFDKIKRVMDLESQRTKSAVGQGAAVVAALDAYLAKYDPVLKAERIRDRKLLRQVKASDEHREPKAATADVSATRTDANTETHDAPAPVTGQMKEKSASKTRGTKADYRPKLPADLKQAIDLRDQGRCTHKDENGTRCPERRWIHYHHVVERSRGGKDTIANLVTLCSSHHLLLHAARSLS